jgi:hypothetical protein
MTHDPSKMINVAYNHLNLPRQITFGPQDNIRYAYTATGARLRKTVSSMKTTSGSVTDYCGEFSTVEISPFAFSFHYNALVVPWASFN